MFTCTLDPHSRTTLCDQLYAALKEEIARSWPNSLDDTCAREEWGWQPDWNLERMTVDMLDAVRHKFEAEKAAAE